MSEEKKEKKEKKVKKEDVDVLENVKDIIKQIEEIFTLNIGKGFNYLQGALGLITVFILLGLTSSIIFKLFSVIVIGISFIGLRGMQAEVVADKVEDADGEDTEEETEEEKTEE